MASKRFLTDSGEDSDIDYEDLIEKKLCTEPEPGKKLENLIWEFVTLVPEKPVIIEPIASSSQSCSSVAIVPADPSLTASLNTELLIKEETSDDEQYLNFDDPISGVTEETIDEEQDLALDEYCEEAEKDDVTETNSKWTKDSSSMTTFLFTKEPKRLIPIPDDPYDIFSMFLDDALLDLIANETNKNGSKHDKEWNPLTREELIIFIGLLLHTGTISLHRLCDYWNIHYLFNINSFSRFMKRERFLQLIDYLSFSSATGQNDVNKIQPVIDYFNKKMNEIYYPGANLIVTKSVTIHCGNIMFGEEETKPKQWIENRVTRVHALMEPKGIVLKLNVTHGSLRRESVVLDLLDEKLDRGHSVYLNEEYNSIQTSLILLGRKTHCTGLLRDYFVKPIQASLKKLVALDDLYDRDYSYYCDGIHLCKRRKQFYLSSQYNEELLLVPTSKGRLTKQTKLVAMYNSVMDLDTKDHLAKYYPCRENSLHWHKKVFLHVLQVAIVNAYKLQEISSRFYNFRLDILEKMLPSSHGEAGSKVFEHPKRPHVLTKIKKVKIRQRRGRSGVITETREVVRKECRGCRMKRSNKRTSTIYECVQCEGSPGYCQLCFERCHGAKLA